MKDIKVMILNIVVVAFLGFSLPLSLIAQDIALTIIGNEQSAPSQIDMNQLQSIMRGEKLRWEDGTTIKIALMKTSTPIGKSTCQKVYNMTPNELNKYFLALVFQGKVKAPTFFNSTSELEEYVSQTPGAIGVIQNAPADPLKIILIDGEKQI